MKITKKEENVKTKQINCALIRSLKLALKTHKITQMTNYMFEVPNPHFSVLVHPHPKKKRKKERRKKAKAHTSMQFRLQHLCSLKHHIFTNIVDCSTNRISQYGSRKEKHHISLELANMSGWVQIWVNINGFKISQSEPDLFM